MPDLATMTEQRDQLFVALDDLLAVIPDPTNDETAEAIARAQAILTRVRASLY